MTQNLHKSQQLLLLSIWLERSTPRMCFLNALRLVKFLSSLLTFDQRACLHGGGGPQVGVVTCGGSPHPSCKRDQIKMRDYKDRRVTSPA